jgi:hypothetical protein
MGAKAARVKLRIRIKRVRHLAKRVQTVIKLSQEAELAMWDVRAANVNIQSLMQGGTLSLTLRSAVTMLLTERLAI